VGTLGVDMLAFPGHKGLLGPTGTGGLYIREGLELQPLLRGGTGSDSALEWQPAFMPDAYEMGRLSPWRPGPAAARWGRSAPPIL
jgi:cysteine desulfurase/selenocysteine lyase